MLQFECIGNKSVSVVLESVVNVNSESEINCYEREFRDGEEHPFNQYTYDDFWERLL
jgi:type IV secretory pathway TrbF-like protein